MIVCGGWPGLSSFASNVAVTVPACRNIMPPPSLMVAFAAGDAVN